MASYNEYRSNAAELPTLRKWIFRALLLSLLLHGGLFTFFWFKKVDNFSMANTATLAPPKFVVKQVMIDEKVLRDSGESKIERIEKVPHATIQIPDEKPVAKDIELKPQIKEVTSPLL